MKSFDMYKSQIYVEIYLAKVVHFVRIKAYSMEAYFSSGLLHYPIVFWKPQLSKYLNHKENCDVDVRSVNEQFCLIPGIQNKLFKET